jgi:Tol biopolymer transport system component
MRWISRGHILIVLLLLLALLPGVGHARAADERCFPETNQCISGRFRVYWDENGGLPVFGFPITPARDERNRDTGQAYLTQWFQRNRFELHPENATPYDVLLGRLGDDRLRQQGRDWQSFFPKADPAAPHYFVETGHSIAPIFWDYWRSHGLEFDGSPGKSAAENLALFGYPISEGAMETNSSGDLVFTQWFERARFEWHTENRPPFDVLLGLLGSEVRRNSGDAPERGQIAFMRDGDLYMMSAGGGDLTRFTTSGDVEGQPVWSPNAQWIAFTTRRELYVIRRDGAQQTRLTAGSEADAIVREPSWSPDGQHIAFERDWDVYVVNADGSGLINLTHTPSDSAEYGAAWSPDGGQIAFIRNGDIFVMNADGGAQQQLTRDLSSSAALQWSPDGRRIAFTAYPQRGNGDIYLMNADGSGLLNLTTSENINDTSAVWSPDGGRIAFESNRDPEAAEEEIYLMDSDGSHSTRLTLNDAIDTSISWSPDGQYMAFVSDRSGSFGVYAMRANGTEQTFLAAGNASAWSPR